MDLVYILLLALAIFLLFGAGVLGVPFGIYRAWPKKNQPTWNWTPILLISVPSALVAYVTWPVLAFMISGGQGR